jgi:hypothetical protein
MLEANPEIAIAAIWAAVLPGKHLARKAAADLPSSPWQAQVLTAA